MRWILTRVSLFVAVVGSTGNYLQITGCVHTHTHTHTHTHKHTYSLSPTGPPIYNVIGCTYIPLLARPSPMTIPQPRLPEHQQTSNGLAHKRDSHCPVLRKPRLYQAKAQGGVNGADVDVPSSLDTEKIVKLLPPNKSFRSCSVSTVTRKMRKRERECERDQSRKEESVCVRDESTLPYGSRRKALRRRRKRALALLRKRASDSE